MTSPKLSHQIKIPGTDEDLGRMYSREPGGEPLVPSITTVMGMQNPRMEWWRGKCAGQTAIEVAPLIIQRKSESRSENEWKQKSRQIEDYISEAAVRDMNAAASRGDAVHNYAELCCRNMIGENHDLQQARDIALDQMSRANRLIKAPDSMNQKYLDSVHRFLEDSGIQPVCAEATVWNSTVGYAGTNDLLFMWHDELVLGDWKTKKKLKMPNERYYKPSIRTNIILQLLSAYHGEEAYDEATDQWGEWQGKEATKFVGIALGPNGYEAMEVFPSEQSWQTFQALKIAWDWYYEDTMNPESHRAPMPLDVRNPWGAETPKITQNTMPF